MTARSASVIVGLVMAALCGWGTRAAAAVPAPPAAAGATVKAEARERFDRGLRLFESGDNSAAMAEFKRAYELIPNPVVLYNMGLVYAAMNRPVEATDTLDSFIAQAGEKSSPEQRRQAQKVRDEQAARISRVLVVTDRPATVEIDGVEAGRTPMTEPLRMASGAHTVTALAPGYQPSRREVTLAGQVKETVSMTLLPTESGAAHLVIATPLPGAAVWLNDKLVGTTPLAASVAVAPGDVRVELRRDGYIASMRSLRVDQGATAKVDLTMEEDPAAVSHRGTLRLVLPESTSTEITVDGVARPASPQGIPLPAGPHALRVQRASFEPYGTAVQIEADRPTTLVVNMTPTLETRARDEDAVHGRHVLGGSILGAGLVVAAGAATYAIVTRSDVSNAEGVLNTQLAAEHDPTQRCYNGADRVVGRYEVNQCAASKSNDQNDLDSAKLRRLLAYSAIGAGAIVAGVGAYLVATAGSVRNTAAVAETQVGLWSTGQGVGLSLATSF